MTRLSAPIRLSPLLIALAVAGCDEEGETDSDGSESMTTAASTMGGSSSGDMGSSGGGSTGGDDASGDDGSSDGGSTDTGSTDGGSTDGGSTNGGSTDGGSTDTGSSDTGSSDDGTDGSTGTGGPGEEVLYTFGNPGNDFLFGVGVDSNGDVYLGGRTQGDFVGDAPAGSIPGFVHKVSEDGTPDWFVQFINPGTIASVNGLVVDSNDDVIVFGSTSTPFVTKLDSDGNELWTFAPSFGVLAAAVDSADNIILAGQGPTGDAYVATYAPQGVDAMTAPDPLYTALVGEGNGANERALAVAIDDDDNVHIAGTTTGVFTTANLGGTDAIVTMLDPTLVEFVARRAQWGTEFDDEPTGIAVDAAGAAYVIGTTENVIDFMGVFFPELDGFARKYDATGLVWADTFEAFAEPGFTEITDDAPRGIVVDLTGEVFVTGQSVELEEGLGLGGGGDIFERVYDPDDGAVLGNESWGTVNLDGADATTLGSWGPISAGYTFGDLDTPEIQAGGDRQLWVLIP